jgi:hypothetical protein
MKSKTAYNHQRRLLQLLQSTWSETEMFCRDHMAHIQCVKDRIYNDAGYKRCPGHVKSFLSGYNMALWDKFTREKIIWVLPFNGMNYAKWDNLPEEGKEEYRKGILTGKHVHKRDNSKDW